MVEGIMRPLTEDEKKEMKEIGSIDIFKVFKNKKDEYEYQMTKSHKPFCGRCARLDFEDRVKRRIDELTRRRQGYTESRDSKELMEMGNFDFSRYADKARFNLLATNEVTEWDKTHRPYVPYVTGVNEDYECIERGCKLTVFVPKEAIGSAEAKVPVGKAK